MSDSIGPQLPTVENFESPSSLFSPLENLKDIKNFFRTRKAVLAGEKLYNMGSVALSDLGLMGPWKFNITQSLLCSIPGSLVAAIIWLIPPAHGLVTTPILDPVQAKCLSVLQPFVPPFTLLLIVFSVAYCSLPTGLETKKNWKAAQRKYLYLDAAYGVFLQLALSLCFALLQLAAYDSVALKIVANVAMLVYLVSFFWQGTVTGWKIREELFNYDYIDKPEMFATLDEPPLFKFYVLLVFAVTAIAWLMSVGLAGLTYGVSVLIHHLRGQ
jgi:hypothetical protein